ALDQLNGTLSRGSSDFNEENQRNPATTLKNVKAGSDNLESTMKRVNDSVTKADEVFGNLQQATKPLAERGPSVMKNLDESTDKFNRTLNDLRDLLRGINQNDGTFRRFMADPALYNNLNDAALMLNRIMPRLDRVLKDVEVFADKIARNREL